MSDSQQWNKDVEPLMKLVLKSKAVRKKEVAEAGKKMVTICRGKDVKAFLLKESKVVERMCPALLSECCKGKAPSSDSDANVLGQELIRNRFLSRVMEQENKAKQSDDDTKKRKRRFPDKVVRVAPQYNTFDVDGYFVVNYEGCKTLTYVLLALSIAGVLSMCMFSIWPLWAKIGVWYVAVFLSSSMLGLMVVRALIFVPLWVLGIDFWIFPNLLDEYAGFLDSFVPLYSFDKRQDDWVMVGIRVGSCFMLAAGLYQLSQTHSLADVSGFAKTALLDVIEWGENKLAESPLAQSKYKSIENIVAETADVELEDQPLPEQSARASEEI